MKDINRSSRSIDYHLRHGRSIACAWLIAALMTFLAEGSAVATEDLIGASQLSTSSDESTPLETLTLEAALSTAMSDNNNLQMAHQAVELARAAGRSAMAAFYPDLSMAYSWTRFADASKVTIPGSDNAITISPKDSFRFGLTWKYPLFNGGQDKATQRASDAGTEQAEFRVDQAKMLVGIGVTTAYTMVLEAREGLIARQASLDHLTEMLRVAQANFDAGYLPNSDLLSIQVARAQAQQAVSEMERNIELAQSGLAIAIGADITKRWELASIEFPEKDIPYDMNTLWDWAVSSRPELKEIKAQRDAVLAQMDAIRSGRRPRINFQGDLSKSAENPTLAGSGGGFSGGMSISGTIGIWWDLYDFGRTDTTLDPMREQLKLLDIQEGSLKDQVKQEVESSLLNVRTQLGNLEVMRRAVAQADEAYRVALRRQQEGLGITLEVLNAESTLAQTSAGLTHLQYEYYRGLANLAQSIGMATDDLIVLLTASGEGVEN